MDELKFKKAEILARQILLSFVDFNRAILPFFDKARFYRIPFKEYDKFRLEDKEKFRREIYRLKRAGFIKKYFAGRDASLEITEKGKKQLKSYLTEQLELNIPQKWDKKWRIVIFDIPNSKKRARDILRNKLETLGFIDLQESVYVYPFDCLFEINFLKKLYFLSPYIQYIVADRIESEVNLLQLFYDRGLLKEDKIPK